MNLAITQVPFWVSILFILSFSTAPIFLILRALKWSLKKTYKDNYDILKFKIIAFYSLFFGIVSILSLNGFFLKNVMPPRIIIFAALPLFLFYVFFVQKFQWFKNVFKNINLEQLIFIHIFRFVGIFFYINYYYGALPKQFAFIGGTGDIVTAILIFPVIFVLREKSLFANKIVFIWNIIGLIDIFSVLFSAITITTIAIENSTLGIQQFGTFPFSWIPAFAPATIIFLHVLIFRKLKEV